jgi:hypothetical protein
MTVGLFERHHLSLSRNLSLGSLFTVHDGIKLDLPLVLAR